MRVLSLLLLCAIAFLCYDMYAGRNGYLSYQEASAELELQKQRAQLLNRRYQAAQDELNDLKQGNAAIEELARSELGLIKEGEVFYRVIGGGQTGHGQ